MASPPEANSSDPKTTRIIILKIGTGHGLLKKSSTGTPANKTSYPKAPTAAGVKRERDKEEQVEPTPERKKAKISLQTCAICAVQLATSQFPEHPHAKSVDRGACSEVCLICFDKHIKAEITNKSFKIVNCPQCSQTLTELEVRKLTEHTDTYQKYIDSAAKSYIQEEEEFHACLNADCSEGELSQAVTSIEEEA